MTSLGKACEHKEMPHVVIVGAGAVGSNTALVLDKLRGIQVTLISDRGLLQGSAIRCANLAHTDSFEYYKRDHVLTGEGCMDGGSTEYLARKGMCDFKLSAPHAHNPTRFFVSKQTQASGLSESEFFGNVDHMGRHFSKQHAYITERRGKDAATEKLGRTPEQFSRPLRDEEWDGLKPSLAYGVMGSSHGVDMARYYGVVRASLDKSQTKTELHANITSFERLSDGRTTVQFTDHAGSSKKVMADYVILAAGHHNPWLATKVPGSLPSCAGTHFLNYMLHLRLPATHDKALIKYLSTLNFTLQGPGGCMLLGVRLPTETEDGVATVYYPDEQGNQFAKHTYNPGKPECVPAWWDDILAKGLPHDHPNIQASFKRACEFYPYLRGYAAIEHVVWGTVFNADEKTMNPDGLDRRVRIIANVHHVTHDARIAMWHSPKWTTALLVAFMAANDARVTCGLPPLPRDEVHGFGPYKLDMEKITGEMGINFDDVTGVDPSSLDAWAKQFVTENDLPERLARHY